MIEPLNESDVIMVTTLAAVGAIGGAVRICSVNRPHSPKAIIGGLMLATMVALLMATFLHTRVKDTLRLVGLCCMSGYTAQTTAAIISKIWADSLRKLFGLKGGNGE